MSRPTRSSRASGVNGDAGPEIVELNEVIKRMKGQENHSPVVLKFLIDLREQLKKHGVPNRYELLAWVTDYDWP